MVAGSPPRFCYSAFLETEEGEAFQRMAAQAQQNIDEGHPDALIDTPYPTPILVSSEVFIDKYGPEDKYDILKYLPDVRAPLLVMIGTEEAQTMMAFKGLPPKMDKLAGELEHLTFEFIPGADHAYTHKREYVWGVVSRWLEKV